MRSIAVRAQVERALADRYPAPFTFRERGPAEKVPSGVPAIDALTGGLPRGALTEIVGPASSGRTSLMLAALAQITGRQEACALVDAQDTFDPQSAELAGVHLERLLWVRCGNLDQTFKAAEFLLAGGGLGLVAVDLGNLPPRMASRVPLAFWFRLQHAIENTPTILLVLESAPYAKSCAALVLQVKAETAFGSTAGIGIGESIMGNRNRESRDFSRTLNSVSHTCLLRGARLTAEVVRSRETGNSEFDTQKSRIDRAVDQRALLPRISSF